MHARSLVLIAMSAFALVACDDDDNNSTGLSNTATVRVVNANATSMDVANNGTVSSGNGNLGFGGSSSCMSVNTSGASGSGLSFNQAGTSTSIPGFSQGFTSGGNYTVFAYPSTSGTSGTTRYLTLSNGSFTANSGQAGLRIVNLASGSGNIVANSGGSALGTGAGVAFGSGGSFMSVPSGSQAITFNTGTGSSTIANAGTLNFTAGQNYTLVVAPAATTGGALRTFLVSGC